MPSLLIYMPSTDNSMPPLAVVEDMNSAQMGHNDYGDTYIRPVSWQSMSGVGADRFYLDPGDIMVVW